MTDKDPRPLKSAGETPAELVRALRALGQPDRDSARLARVAERLGARVAASGDTPAASGLGKLIGTKTAWIGLVLGFGVLGVLGYVLSADRRAPAAPAHAPESLAAPIPTPAAAPATRMAGAALPNAPALPSAPAQALTPRAPAFSGQRTRVAQSSERSHAAASTPASSLAPAPAPPPSDVEAQVEPVPANTPVTDAQPRAQPAPPDKPPAARPSEVALLQRARKLASTQPAAALGVLHEHAERFPSGMLTPEREVLTIEVLRRLGRTAEAAQRLQQFAIRYPQSLYLRRLQHEPAD